MSLDALIVEDSPATRLVLQQQLTGRGHRVHALGDAEAAWAACQESAFALIVLDWILPGMDGLALCRRIRTLPWGAACVILVLTSREEPGDLALVLDAGATDYVPKSASMAQLALRLTVAERHIADTQRRIEAEQALRARNARLIGLAEHANDLVTVLDARGTLLYASPSHRWILGYDPEQLMARGPLSIVHPDDRANTEAAFAAARANPGDTPMVQSRLCHADGSWRWMESVLMNRLDDSAIGGVIVTSRDVTARVQAAEALRASEARFHALVATAPVILYALDMNGVFTMYEGNVLTTLGLEPGDRVGHSIFELFKHRPDIVEVAHRALAGETFISVIPIRGVVLESRWSPIRDADGRQTGALSVAIDITAQRQSEEARRASEERLRTVIANAPIILAAIDTEGVFTFSEGSALGTLGVAPGDRVGQSFFELYRDRPDILAVVRRALAGEASTSVAIVGDAVLESRWAPLREPGGQVTGAISVATDITAQWQAEAARRQSEQLLQTVMRNAPVVLTAVNEHGVVIFSSGRGLENIGRSPRISVGRSVFDLLSDAPEAQHFVRRALAGEACSGAIALRGAMMETRYVPLYAADGRVSGAIGVSTDVTERWQAEEALRQSEASLRRLVQAAPIGVTINSEDGRIELPNAAYCEIFGYTPEELIGCPVTMLMPPDVREEEATRYFERISHRVEGQREWVMMHKNGDRLTILSTGLTVIWSDGRPRRVGFIVDITERKQEEQRLVQLAHHDRLTGLPNRTLFTLRLAQALALAQRHDEEIVALLFLDLDGFKAVNDTLGHAAGDLLLKTVAERLLEYVRESDTVARLAGDEFVVLLPGIKTSANASMVARKIINRITQPLLLDGQPARVTASIGISFYPRDTQDASTLLKLADAAMYTAKREGKNRYAFSTGGIEAIGP